MYGFHFLVWSLCVRGIKDTQVCFITKFLLYKTIVFITIIINYGVMCMVMNGVKCNLT